MIGRTALLLAALLLVWALSACGTIEVGLADDDGEESIVTTDLDGSGAGAGAPTPTATATEIPALEPTATATPAAEIPAATATPTTAVQDGPVGWQRFYDAENGVELWHPAGTTAAIGEPSTPVFSSVEFPDGIAEEQVLVVRVIQEEGGPFGPPGPLALLEFKIVANPEGNNVAVMAEQFSKRCPGPASDRLQPTTVNVQLSGFRYSCEGIDGIIFNELWVPHPTDPQLLIGAVWPDMSAPLSDEILATVSITS